MKLIIPAGILVLLYVLSDLPVQVAVFSAQGIKDFLQIALDQTSTPKVRISIMLLILYLASPLRL